jgi:uncharacterized protein YbcV (DUF1398 family)
MFSMELQQLCKAALRASVARWNIIIDSGTVSSLSLHDLLLYVQVCACVRVCARAGSGLAKTPQQLPKP